MFVVFDINYNQYVKSKGWHWKHTDNPTNAKIFKTVAGIKRAFGNFIVKDENGNHMKDKKGNYITYFPEKRFKIVPLDVKIKEDL